MWEFRSQLWLASASDAWTFLTVPLEVSDEIRDVSAPRRGFGSVRVAVVLGSSQWHTSVFPGGKAGSYVLPIKRAVRDKEGVEAPDAVDVKLSLLDG